MKYRVLKGAFGSLCRTCVNEEFHLTLAPQDCYYLMYPRKCAHCGEVKNIVSDIRLHKKLFIRLKLIGRS